MSLFSDFTKLGYASAHKGHRDEAKLILSDYGRRKRWTRETLRARWDGASALLAWWHNLEVSERPPLDRLEDKDARAFIFSLEAKGLARSTIKSYRTGASALTKAIRFMRDPRNSYPAYDPFRDIQPKLPVRSALLVDKTKLMALKDVRARARLKALLELMALGVSLPEACACYWSDVNIKHPELTGYNGRRITLQAEAIEALETLWTVSPKSTQSRNRRVFCWSADTARRWLKLVRVD